MNNRFKVETARSILEAAKLNEVARSVSSLPAAKDFDAAHRKWRKAVIGASKNRGFDFTHGVAAKLINIYLKATFVSAGHHDNPRVRAIHPPIDSILLDSLYENDVGGLRAEWQRARKLRWSKLGSKQYEDVIRAVRQAVGPGQGLWTIEQYWRGFQSP